MKLSVACAQLESKSLDAVSNLLAAESSIREAASRGAQLVLLPEYATTGLLKAVFRRQRERSAVRETTGSPVKLPTH